MSFDWYDYLGDGMDLEEFFKKHPTDFFSTTLKRIDNGQYSDLNKLVSLDYLSANKITNALVGFETEIMKNKQWLAAACKAIMQFCIKESHYFLFEEGDHSYPGNTKIQNELRELIEKVNSTRSFINGLSGFADSSLKTNSAILEEVKFDSSKPNNNIRATDFSLATIRFMESMNSFESFVEQAIQNTCNDIEKPRWRDTMKRKVTLTMAIELSKVYEFSTGKIATLNNWQKPDGSYDHGPWFDFFTRLGCLILKVERIPDTIGILKDARKIRLSEICCNLP